MGKYNFTKKGIRRFGDLLREQMEDAFPPVTARELSNRLTAIGYETNKARINRLRTGLQTEPPAAFIWALAKLKFLKDPSGHPYSHEELLELMTELEPENSMMDDQIPNAAAVNLIKSKMREMHKSIETFARFCEIPPDRMSELLRGAMPTWSEILNLGRVLFEDKNPAPLITLYQISDDSIGATRKSKLRGGEKTD